jgi:hypothetical protein
VAWKTHQTREATQHRLHASSGLGLTRLMLTSLVAAATAEAIPAHYGVYQRQQLRCPHFGCNSGTVRPEFAPRLIPRCVNGARSRDPLTPGGPNLPTRMPSFGRRLKPDGVVPGADAFQPVPSLPRPPRSAEVAVRRATTRTCP